MRLNTNITAITSNNSLQRAESKLTKSIERLSSGLKLNSSADDPAGCAISEKMRLQIRGLNQAENNTADGVSVLNIAEGGIVEIQAMLVRMKELTVQAANDVNSDSERAAIQSEIDEINKEIDRISADTEFNTQSLIDGNLSRRVYSNYSGVYQLECSDSFVAGNYGITVTADARQAIAVGSGTISMSDTATISESQKGIVSVNGYDIEIKEGDTLADVITNIVESVELIGGTAFVTENASDNDTVTNGTLYAGYKPATEASGNHLVIMTDEYGSNQSLTITCDNKELAKLLGIPDAYSEDGWVVQGSDVQAEFTTQSVEGVQERIGFEDSAVMSTDGTKITIKDVNNKTFQFDVPGNIAGTRFDDSDKVSWAVSNDSVDIVQEVTDVGTMSVHIGANENQVIKVDIPPVTTYALGTDTINVMTGVTAANSISKVDKAVERANSIRSKIGAYQNRFEHVTNNLQVSDENITAAISAMSDTDMAEEMTEYTSLTVLTQAATSILSQANERPSTVLQLLQR